VIKLYKLAFAILILGLLKPFNSLAQDPNFSQFYSNRIYMNPAYAGADPGMRVNLNYRRLWASVPGQFQTFSATMDIADFNISGGIGLIALNSVEGEGKLRTTQFGGMYSYRLTVIPRMFDLHFAAQGTFIQKSIDFSNFVFSDQLDPIYGQINETQAKLPPTAQRNMFDASAGILGRFNIKMGRKSRKLMSNTLGASFKHITQPNESLIGKSSPLPFKLTIHYSAIFNVSKRSAENKVYISPNFIYEKQAAFTSFNFGAFVLRAPLMVGVWYRNQKFLISPKKTDSFIMNLGFRGENGSKTFIYQVGYSYDMTLSRMIGSSGGSHEISMIFEFTNLRLFKEKSANAKKKARSCYNFNGPRNLPKIF
jgi:type IX secretion system PorP/SprF family membrane protein